MMPRWWLIGSRSTIRSRTVPGQYSHGKSYRLTTASSYRIREDLPSRAHWRLHDLAAGPWGVRPCRGCNVAGRLAHRRRDRVIGPSGELSAEISPNLFCSQQLDWSLPRCIESRGLPLGSSRMEKPVASRDKSTCSALLRRVGASNSTFSWSEFNQLYSGLIYRYALARGLNDTDALEVVGDCMATLAGKMRDFQYDRGKCRFRTWLKTVTNNAVVSHLRKRRPRQADTTVWSDLEDTASGPDELWERQWELDHLQHCFEQIAKELPAQHAEAFRLYVLEEEPAQQVAEKLGLTAEHVWKIKTRVGQKLKEAMSHFS